MVCSWRSSSVPLHRSCCWYHHCASICCFLRQFGELWSHVAKCLKGETSVNEPKAAQAEEKAGRIPTLAGLSGPTVIIVSSPMRWQIYGSSLTPVQPNSLSYWHWEGELIKEFFCLFFFSLQQIFMAKSNFLQIGSLMEILSLIPSSHRALGHHNNAVGQ